MAAGAPHWRLSGCLRSWQGQRLRCHLHQCRCWACLRRRLHHRHHLLHPPRRQRERHHHHHPLWQGHHHHQHHLSLWRGSAIIVAAIVIIIVAAVAVNAGLSLGVHVKSTPSALSSLAATGLGSPPWPPRINPGALHLLRALRHWKWRPLMKAAEHMVSKLCSRVGSHA